MTRFIAPVKGRSQGARDSAGRGIRMSIPVERSPAGPSVGGMAEKRAENQPVDQDDPTGGDEVTEDQLEADNPVEEDTLKTLDPDSPPA